MQNFRACLYVCWLLTICSLMSAVGTFREGEHSKSQAKQDVPNVINSIVAGLKIIGVLTDMKIPGARAIVSLVTSILDDALPLLFTDGGTGDPKHGVRIEVWNEWALAQKRKMIDFRNSLQEIQRHLKLTLTLEDGIMKTEAEETCRIRMVVLRDEMSRHRCSLFMRSDNVESDGTYFKEFATLYVIVNELVILQYPNDMHWQTELQSHIGDFIDHARYLMFQSPSFYYTLHPLVDKWMQLLDPESRNTYNVNVRYNKWVSFKINDNEVNWWFSCWQINTSCLSSDCPGRDNPMQTERQYRGKQTIDVYKCRSETFKLMNINPALDDIVRSCDSVGIYYDERQSNHYWVTLNDATDLNVLKDSESCDKSFAVNVSMCAGESAASMRNGKCEAQAWKIHARGKSCGSPIDDRDIIYFTNLHRERVCLHIFVSSTRSFWDTSNWFCNYGWHATGFVIFRNDVGYVNLAEKLSCPTK